LTVCCCSGRVYGRLAVGICMTNSVWCSVTDMQRLLRCKLAVSITSPHPSPAQFTASSIRQQASALHPAPAPTCCEHQLAHCCSWRGAEALGDDVALVGLLVLKHGVQQLVQVARLHHHHCAVTVNQALAAAAAAGGGQQRSSAGDWGCLVLVETAEFEHHQRKIKSPPGRAGRQAARQQQW
jgi:hypothetical protein